jgi:hypothetical protein
MANDTHITIEPLHAVKARQAVWAAWMQESTVGLDDDALVSTTTKVTPFGNYLLAVEPADQ